MALERVGPVAAGELVDEPALDAGRVRRVERPAGAGGRGVDLGALGARLRDLLLLAGRDALLQLALLGLLLLLGALLEGLGRTVAGALVDLRRGRRP
jgi:hypothetical protein